MLCKYGECINKIYICMAIWKYDSAIRIFINALFEHQVVKLVLCVRASLRKWSLSRLSNMLMYRTLILPVLDYEADTWTIVKTRSYALVFERKILWSVLVNFTAVTIGTRFVILLGETINNWLNLRPTAYPRKDYWIQYWQTPTWVLIL